MKQLIYVLRKSKFLIRSYLKSLTESKKVWQ